jgi:two-component system NtrC family sensor kinase
VTATRTPPTVGRLLLAGLLALFALSALGTALALATTRAVDAELAAVEHLADTSRRLERVGALFREFYMHQAHLALGMDEAEHLGLTRDARASLGDALTALEAPPVDAVVAQTLPRLREQLAGLDRLLEAEFLPALRAGHASHAAHLHHQAAGSVQAATARIDADQQTLRLAITEARARAAEVTTASITEAALVLSSALVLALGVGFWMVRAVRGPIERLRTAAASLPDRPPGTASPRTAPLEVAALGRSLNGALAELDRQRQARAEAETMASLGRIAAGVAHEINNPLAVMLGHARVLEAVVGPDEDADSARAIADEARHCQHIVQDLLDYARPGLAERVRLEFGELVRGVGERACAGEVDFRGRRRGPARPGGRAPPRGRAAQPARERRGVRAAHHARAHVRADAAGAAPASASSTTARAWRRTPSSASSSPSSPPAPRAPASGSPSRAPSSSPTAARSSPDPAPAAASNSACPSRPPEDPAHGPPAHRRRQGVVSGRCSLKLLSPPQQPHEWTTRCPTPPRPLPKLLTARPTTSS